MPIASPHCPFCAAVIDVGSSECPSCRKPLPAKQQPTGVFALEGSGNVPQPEALKPSTLKPLGMMGPYRLMRKIGEGGMGYVYEAVDTRLNRHVALKTIESGNGMDENLVARFRREAQNAAKLKHPHIVSVHDIGNDGNFDFFTMDLVEGLTLDKWIKGTHPALNSLVKIIEKVARALHYAHSQGVIHRDVKPGNIMIDNNGEPQIMDFGLARNTKDSSNLTLSGSIIGTPAYMAPEQTMGESKDIGAATDVWALGVILYEILVEKPPFDNGNVYQTIYAVLHSDPESPRKVKRDLPKDLETIVLKCLEKTTARRYENSEALANDLAAWLEGRPIGVRAMSWWEKLRKKFLSQRAISMDEFMLEQEARHRAEAEKLELETRVESESKKEWKLIFEDDFNDPDIESRWEVYGGKWELGNGELRCFGGTPQVLYLKKPVSGDIKIEFECRQEGPVLGDISCFLAAVPVKDRRRACDTGYMFQIGGVSNSRTFIETPQRRLIERHDSIIPGKAYRISVEKSGSRLALSIDGQIALEVEDPLPLIGSDRVSVGFYGWRAGNYYSKVKIYRLGYPVKTDILEMAERQLQTGKYEFAIELFEEVCVSHEDPVRQEQARQGLKNAKSCLEMFKAMPQYEERVKAMGNGGRVEWGMGGVSVFLRNQNISSIAPLKGMPILELECAGNQIDDLQPLSEMKTLAKLNVSRNHITDLAPLKELNLQHLSVSYNPLSSIEPLRGSSLESLNIVSTEVSDLRVLSSSKLARLNASYCKIGSLAGLQGLTIKRMGLERNHIKSLDELKGMNLVRLDIQFNQIESLAPLAQVSVNELFCYGNPIQSLDPFLENPPPIFCYDSDTLPASELEAAFKKWKSAGRTNLATQAEALLYLRQGDSVGLRKIAIQIGDVRVLFIPRFVSWYEAAALAQKVGGSLLLSNGLKYSSLIAQLKPLSMHTWIGLSIQKGCMKWNDGQLYDSRAHKELLMPREEEGVDYAGCLMGMGAKVRFRKAGGSGNPAAFFVQWDA
jgi:serine/threonine protein kinase